jgi:hypothetical protein
MELKKLLILVILVMKILLNIMMKKEKDYIKLDIRTIQFILFSNLPYIVGFYYGINQILMKVLRI